MIGAIVSGAVRPSFQNAVHFHFIIISPPSNHYPLDPYPLPIQFFTFYDRTAHGPRDLAYDLNIVCPGPVNV